MIDFENLTLSELEAGFREDGGGFVCIYCGGVFEHGEVFRCGERFFDAERAVRHHVETEHPDRFDTLLEGKYLSLTDNQKELFRLFHGGFGDGEIAKKLGVSASTVRHQKFIFRERAKAAKLYLAVWSLAEKGRDKKSELVSIHEGAKMVDERYVLTEEEYKKILANVFESLEPLKLKVFSSKEKKKIATLRRLTEQFEPGRKYTEKEVNTILGDIYDDFATLRRYLIEYGYMARTDDGKVYWRK